VIFRRDGVIHEPGEDVAHAALAGLIAVHAGDDAAIHHPAHAVDFLQLGADQHVAGGGAHDHDHRARPGDFDGRRGDMRVDVGHRHRDPRPQAGGFRQLRHQAAGAVAKLGEDAAHLGIDHVSKIRVQGGKVLARRIGAVLNHGLVTGGAGVACLDAA